MNSKSTPIEQKLNIPTKDQEEYIFTTKNPEDIYKNYAPLIDFYMGNFMYSNNVIKHQIVEKTEDALWKAILLYQKNSRYKEKHRFITYFAYFFYEIINEYLSKSIAFEI